MRHNKSNQDGLIIVSILIISLFLSVLMMALIVYASSNVTRARGRILTLESQYAAESGADAAIATYNSDPNSTYAGTGNSETTVLSGAKYKATFQTSVANGSAANERLITSTGRVYVPASATSASHTRKIEVTMQRTAGSATGSGIISRNIIEIASGVKNLYALDLYVNGYINTEKNTTNLISENITVAGKNTGATNCSIGGPGNLVKPATFTDPSQTKTNIILAYNNYINPPGNSSNSNFTVSANQNSINKVQSTYIPWSQYMDSSYTNAGSCNDWTVGTSTVNIPTANGSKKTHYPDSGSNVSSSCGTSGDLSLGTKTYNINDNVHIRANLCKSSICSPTFYNPDPNNPKYVFVEGSINFGGVYSGSGSGPIVLVSYAADPATHPSCPLGDAIYLGNSPASAVLRAPQMYFLANNGICMDNTKFDTNTNFGGLSGKNIYISTNPSNTFYPTLNTTFPWNNVPTDLSWHAARYRRL